MIPECKRSSPGSFWPFKHQCDSSGNRPGNYSICAPQRNVFAKDTISEANTKAAPWVGLEWNRILSPSAGTSTASGHNGSCRSTNEEICNSSMLQLKKIPVVYYFPLFDSKHLLRWFNYLFIYWWILWNSSTKPFTLEKILEGQPRTLRYASVSFPLVFTSRLCASSIAEKQKIQQMENICLDLHVQHSSTYISALVQTLLLTKLLLCF